MSTRRSDLPLWFSLFAIWLIMEATRTRPAPAAARDAEPAQGAKGGGPFGETRSSAQPRSVQLRRASEHGRGRRADRPWQIPWAGWKDIFWRTYAEMNSDRLLSIAGGVAFFILFAIFPAITALVSAYGMFFDPSAIAKNLTLLQGVVPANVLSILHDQAVRIASGNNRTLSIGIIAGILVALWSAMSGVKAMIDALNVIYEQDEGRSFLKFNLVGLAFTLGGLAAFVVAIGAVVVLPLVLSSIGLGGSAAMAMRVVRWPALLVVLLAGLAVLYRYGPHRRAARWRWVSVGSVFAAVVWIGASYLFSWYLTSFANYNATYGSLGAVVAMMMWLWISTIVVLLGAELNAEIEHQTARDSTVGGDKPLGDRGAVMADTVGARQS